MPLQAKKLLAIGERVVNLARKGVRNMRGKRPGTGNVLRLQQQQQQAAAQQQQQQQGQGQGGAAADQKPVMDRRRGNSRRAFRLQRPIQRLTSPRLLPRGLWLS